MRKQKVERREKLAQKVGRRKIYSPVPPPSTVVYGMTLLIEIVSLHNEKLI